MRAEGALKDGFFAKEIVPVDMRDKGGSSVVARDEHPRPGATLEKLAHLRLFFPGGMVTAGNASGIYDGAAAHWRRHRAWPSARHERSSTGAHRRTPIGEIGRQTRPLDDVHRRGPGNCPCDGARLKKDCCKSLL